MPGPLVTELHALPHPLGTQVPAQPFADVPPPAVPIVAAVAAADGSEVTPGAQRASAVAFYFEQVDFLVETRLNGDPVVVGNDRDQLLTEESAFIVKTVQPAAQRDLLLKDWPHDTPELCTFRRAAFADILFQGLSTVGIEAFQRLADFSQHPALIAFANCALNVPKEIDPKDHLSILREWFATSPFGVADCNDSVVNLIEAATVLELFVRATDRPRFLLALRFGSVLNSSGHDSAVPTDPVKYAAGVRQVVEELIERQPPVLVMYLSRFANAFGALGSQKALELDQTKFTTRVGTHRVIITSSGRETAATVSRLKLNRDYVKLFDEFCGTPFSDRPLDQFLLQFFTMYRAYHQLSSLTRMPLSHSLTLTDSHVAILGGWTRRACRNELLQWGNVLRAYYATTNDPNRAFNVNSVHSRDFSLYGRHSDGKFSIRSLDDTSIAGHNLSPIPSSPAEFRVGVACIFMHHFEGIVADVAGRIRAGKLVPE